MSKKIPEVLPKSWKVNGNIFFELFLHDLDKKNDLSRLQKITKQKTKQDGTTEPLGAKTKVKLSSG